jgi:hypothetical protein
MMLASVPDFYGQLSSYQLQLVVSYTAKYPGFN